MPKNAELTKQQEYANVFDAMGPDWEIIVSERDTEKEVNFIESLVSRKGVILDLCCGTGRHCINLSRKGLEIIGMDIARNLLRIAKQKMKREGMNLHLVRADMRYLPFKDFAFKSVISMYTSFGYLPSEYDDIRSLLEVNRTIQPNGLFLLDLFNRDRLIENFQERDWAEFRSFYMLEERSMNFKDSKLSSQWTLIKKDSRELRVLQHEVRLYNLAQIEHLLTLARLSVESVYGDYEKQDFNLEASRMIVLSRKT